MDKRLVAGVLALLGLSATFAPAVEDQPRPQDLGAGRRPRLSASRRPRRTGANRARARGRRRRRVRGHAGDLGPLLSQLDRDARDRCKSHERDQQPDDDLRQGNLWQPQGRDGRQHLIREHRHRAERQLLLRRHRSQGDPRRDRAVRLRVHDRQRPEGQPRRRHPAPVGRRKRRVSQACRTFSDTKEMLGGQSSKTTS